MAKTYTAQSVNPNHDIDVNVDDAGNITGWTLSAEVNFGAMGRTEELDIWPLLTPAQKETLQTAYNRMREIFRKHLLGS